MKEQHAKLIVAMTTYDHGDPMRIQHFMKVHDFASAIGVLEGLDQETLFVLETAAVLHDIGIHLSEENTIAVMANIRKQRDRKRPGF